MLVCLCKIVNEHEKKSIIRIDIYSKNFKTPKVNTLIYLDEFFLGSGKKNVFILPFVYVPFDLQLSQSCQISSILLTTLDHTLLGYTFKVDGSLNRIEFCFRFLTLL